MEYCLDPLTSSFPVDGKKQAPSHLPDVDIGELAPRKKPRRADHDCHEANEHVLEEYRADETEHSSSRLGERYELQESDLSGQGKYISATRRAVRIRTPKVRRGAHEKSWTNHWGKDYLNRSEFSRTA